MLPTNPRELERLLRRMGIKVEEVPAAAVEIRLRTGEVLRLSNPTVALLRMPNRLLVYQVQVAEGDVEREAPPPPPQQQGYQPTEEDIGLVMEQTGATREEAYSALVEAKGDLVQAAMLVLKRRQGK